MDFDPQMAIFDGMTVLRISVASPLYNPSFCDGLACFTGDTHLCNFNVHLVDIGTFTQSNLLQYCVF